MKVEDLIKQLESMPKDAPVLVEGVEPDRIILEKTGPGNAYVRIFKSWDVDFVPKYTSSCMACPLLLIDKLCEYPGYILSKEEIEKAMKEEENV